MLEDVLPTPRVNARIEPPHGLRDALPVRIRNLDLDGRESSVLDAFGVIQMSAVGMRQAYRLVLRDGHVVHVVAVPLRVEAGRRHGEMWTIPLPVVPKA